ncbi:hypothetical protein LCGC14_1751290 [marine sediment metagenome]|uniref:Uncharacterized protein n=1 Tax=marine sediment metagenome TaxID=412755 RepID=A0A0F9H3W6_9ZZZZ
MTEIESSVERAQKWQRFLNTGIDRNRIFRYEWCVIVGLYETAVWVNDNQNYQNYFLDWVKPGHKDI